MVFNLTAKPSENICGELGIRNGYSTPAYPQGNGQSKATNKVLVTGLKKRLDDTKGKWVDELPHVLWTIVPHSEDQHGRLFFQ